VAGSSVNFRCNPLHSLCLPVQLKFSKNLAAVRQPLELAPWQIQFYTGGLAQGDTMKPLSMLALTILVASSFFSFKAAQQSQADSERYIIECEGQWAASTASGDLSAVRRFVADDFRGVDPDGNMYDRQDAISDKGTGPQTFVSNHTNEVKVRFYGDAAVAQGSESWERRTGQPLYGRYVWTDTWIRRNGQWQVVAAEDVEVAENPPAK
jgi:ketosteroid isomerase-like protein